MKRRLKVFLFILILTAILIFLYYSFYLFYLPKFQDLLLFTFLIFISHNASFFIISSSKVSTSIKLPIILPGIIIIGPFWMGIIAVIFSTNIKGPRPAWYKILFNRSNYFVSIISAGLIYNLSNSFFELYFNTKFVLFSFLFAAITYYFVNNLLLYIVLRLSGETHPENIIRYFSQLTKNVFVSYILALIFYVGYIYIGSIFLILSLILIYIVKDFFYSKLQQMNTVTQVVESFLKVIDSKDDYTEGHCERVSEYTGVLCRKAGLKYNEIEKIVNMAKIHDIGKISVSDDILKSSGKLTKSEFEEMKNHSKYGCEILDDLDIFKEDIDIIKYHHERYDGSGYPEGLSGEKIPLGSRILSICDAYDVMSTGRVYKPSLNKEEIITEFKECAGEQFDPNYADMMIELIQNNKIGGLN